MTDMESLPILYQNPGSSSFVARIALEEAGVPYDTVDVASTERSGPPGFLVTAPTRLVPALDDEGVNVFECGALLLYLADRFPEAQLGPTVGHPDRGDYVSWMMWTANTLHVAMDQIEKAPARLLDVAANVAQEKATLLEQRLAARAWIVGETFTLVDAYVYMLVGWQHFTDGLRLGGDALQAHFARVGTRPAVMRARALDHLDERLLPSFGH